jgi:hypothetical protein
VRIEINEMNSGSMFKQRNKGMSGTESTSGSPNLTATPTAALLEAEPKVAFGYCRSWPVSADDRLK